jgi:hypothetical protein
MNTVTALVVLLVFVFDAGRAAELVREAVVITARPKFKTENHFRYLILSDGKRSYKTAWAAVGFVRQNACFYPISLRTQKSYTFSIIEEPNPWGEKSAVIPQLIRVEEDGRVIYDAEICEIHQRKMEQKEVEIANGGLVAPDSSVPSARTERRKFPHRYEISFGGCEVFPDSPKTKTIYVCGECKNAYQKWKPERQESKR